MVVDVFGQMVGVDSGKKCWWFGWMGRGQGGSVTLDISISELALPHGCKGSSAVGGIVGGGILIDQAG